MIRTLIALLMFSLPATAADFSIAHGQETGRTYIGITGAIEPGDALKLRAYAAMNPTAEWVALSSPGGLANAGYKLGYMISKLELNTYVGFGSACVSACYIAFLGGKDYDIDGVLAAHNAWIKDTGDFTVNQGINQGQALGAYDTYYHLANGFNFALPYMITAYTDKNTFVAFTDEKELNAFFVRDAVDKIVSYLDSTVGNTDENWVEKHVVKSADLAALSMIKWNAKFPDHFDPRK